MQHTRHPLCQFIFMPRGTLKKSAEWRPLSSARTDSEMLAIANVGLNDPPAAVSGASCGYRPPTSPVFCATCGVTFIERNSLTKSSVVISLVDTQRDRLRQIGARLDKYSAATRSACPSTWWLHGLPSRFDKVERPG
jgi:hypothetical protein